MSLLDNGANYELITVYLEEEYEDEDGNPRTRPSANGIQAEARFQVLGQSGTSSRRQEQDNEGYESEKVYEMRLPRSFPYIIGAQSQIEWNGQRWVIFGDVNRYNSSRMTRHNIYTIKRY